MVVPFVGAQPIAPDPKLTPVALPQFELKVFTRPMLFRAAYSLSPLIAGIELRSGIRLVLSARAGFIVTVLLKRIVEQTLG